MRILSFPACLVAALVAVPLSVLAAPPQTDAEKLGYIIGMDIGMTLRQQGSEIDLEALFDAIRTVHAGEPPALSAEEAQSIRDAYIGRRRAAAEAEREAKAGANASEGDAFLLSNRSAAGVVVTASGLQYKVLEPGSGPRPGASDRVRVHYRGTLLNGEEFDSSYARGEPITFQLDQVIPGWTEGVQLMPVGSKYRFWIPPGLGYGSSGSGPVGPGATMVFEVELLGIEDS